MLGRALENLAPLFVGLERQVAPAAGLVLDLDMVEQAVRVHLEHWFSVQFQWDSADAIERALTGFPIDVAEQLLLDDVARGLVRVAGGPCIDRVIEDAAFPPVRIIPCQVAADLVAACHCFSRIVVNYIGREVAIRVGDMSVDYWLETKWHTGYNSAVPNQGGVSRWEEYRSALTIMKR